MGLYKYTHMSTEKDKFYHSKRLLKDQNAVKKQTKILKSKLMSDADKNLQQPNRLNKHHAMNCGKPKCTICGNPRKIFGEKTIQEKRFLQIDKQKDKNND